MLAWGIVAGLSVAALVLLGKLHLLRRSIREIEAGFALRLREQTNTLLDVSSRDAAAIALANTLNRELAALRDQRLRYQQGDSELRAAIASISHDLRTPLTAICGYLEMAQKEEMNEALSRYLRIIGERAGAMKGLTEELFRYSVILSADEPLALAPVDLKGVVEEAIAGQYGALCDRSIVPEIALPEGEVMRSLNREAMLRVMDNLLSNAVRYAQGGLSVRLSQAGKITVSNPAPTLDEVQVGRLFDRFYTVEAARGSTGLGLSIAKALTERMGGTIAARFEQGRLVMELEFKG